MNDNTAYNKGIIGENKALNYLNGLGMQHLQSRYKTRYGEIDLIMQQGDTIVFVEVKYRKKGLEGDGLYAVTKQKQNKFSLAAQQYIQENNLQCFVRIDVIEIIGDKINHIQNAF
ncbi:MAG: YraN family protein [Christensenellaceae bacterium]|nr:YraN family protein [Christensenellaceae bacterium]